MDASTITRRIGYATMTTAVLAWPLLLVAPAAASCVETTEAEQRAQADVVFDGRALPGPAADGALLSPARFAVDASLEGGGPDVVEVVTATRDEGGGTVSHLSVGIDPRAGETWRIYATRPDGGGPLETSVCAGSIRLAEGHPGEAGGLEPGTVAPGDGPPGPASAGSDGPVAELVVLGVAVVTAAVAALTGRGWRRRRAA
jgi:hypothetical protein